VDIQEEKGTVERQVWEPKRGPGEEKKTKAHENSGLYCQHRTEKSLYKFWQFIAYAY
jgi:hypothetical protein